MKAPYIFGIGLILMMSVGCATHPKALNNIVQVAPNISVAMPQPVELGHNLSASQIVIVEYAGEVHRLPVQLEVDGDRLALAGFSSWGQRIVSLRYENGSISTSIMTGLNQQLPDPRQILFNVMIMLWPVEAWNASLEDIGWELKESMGKRQLIDEKQQVVATMTYKSEPYLDGVMVFVNHLLELKVTIKTLSYSQ